MVSKKIAIIGSTDTTLPFSAIGAETFAVSDSEKAEKKLREILPSRKFGIVFVEEAMAVDFADEIKALNELYRDVSITSIAGSQGSLGRSVEKIQGYVKKAIGLDIFAQK